MQCPFDIEAITCPCWTSPQASGSEMRLEFGPRLLTAFPAFRALLVSTSFPDFSLHQFYSGKGWAIPVQGALLGGGRKQVFLAATSTVRSGSKTTSPANLDDLR